MLFYISSPITKGDSAEHAHNAIEVAEALVRRGHGVIVPQLSILWQVMSPHNWKYWLNIDLQIVPRCDALFRLPGESEGADVEVDKAKAHGLQIYTDINAVPIEGDFRDNISTS